MNRKVEHIIFCGDDPLFPTQIIYVAPMNAEELAELEEFIALWLRSMRRRTKNAEVEAMTSQASR